MSIIIKKRIVCDWCTIETENWEADGWMEVISYKIDIKPRDVSKDDVPQQDPYKDICTHFCLDCSHKLIGVFEKLDLHFDYSLFNSKITKLTFARMNIW